MIYGTGKYRYRVVEGWGRGPGGREFDGVLTGLATDSEDRVYIARRAEPAVLVYSREGEYLGSWGQDLLDNPHGMHVDREDHVWVTDAGGHTVQKFTTDGELLMTIGVRGQPGEPDMPFNRPTKAVTTPAGDFYVSDGYGQFRVHHFGADGSLLHSWGSEGTGPGEFKLPHSVSVDEEGRVLVPDRENNRIQIFDRDGDYLSEWSYATWPGIQWPNEAFIAEDGTIYLTEAGYRVSVWKRYLNPEQSPIWSPCGDYELLARFGDMGDAPGQFATCPHAICVDSQGSIYVAEVPTQPNRLQKFERIE